MDFETQFARDVLAGLSAKPKYLLTKYTYNGAGSQLFEQIMQLPEYYLTRTETNILETHKEQIATEIGEDPFNLVELGAGNGAKTMLLLEQLLKGDKPFTYVPIDISGSAIADLTEWLVKDLPDLEVEGLVKEYFEGLQWLRTRSKRRNVVLFLGSNIGNFGPTGQRKFLQNLWMSLRPDDLVIIGFDLRKPYYLIQQAYDDRSGVTREFNFNLLKRINEDLGGQFNLENFEYYAMYNPNLSANESFLYSIRDQLVYIEALQSHFRFESFEPIHTEYSFKFSAKEIEQLARDNRFRVVKHLTDKNEYFIDSIWQVRKP